MGKYKDTNDPRIKQNRNRHYAENKQVYKDRARAYREAIAKATKEMKDKPCMDCGGRFHYSAMDFDHRDNLTKSRNVAHIVSSMKILLEEVANAISSVLTATELEHGNAYRGEALGAK